MKRNCTSCVSVRMTRYYGFAIAKVWAKKTLVYQVVKSEKNAQAALRSAIAWCEDQGCNWMCKELCEGIVHI